MQTNTEDWLDAILDDMDWGYTYAMSDYATSTAEEEQMEIDGLEAIAKAKAAILTKIKQVEVEARIEEVKNIEQRLAREFDRLCEEVRTNPNLGNSSKGKKDNFLDGAEIMLTKATVIKNARLSQLSKEAPTKPVEENK